MIKRLKDIYESYRLSKYYQSIRECPMYNWISVFEDKDFKHLSKTGRVCKRAESVYNKLQDEIINNFGINEDFLEILRKKIKIELLYADMIAKKDMSRITFIEILEAQITELEQKQTKGDVYELVMAVEKKMGFKLDVKHISIFEFYKYTKLLK